MRRAALLLSILTLALAAPSARAQTELDPCQFLGPEFLLDSQCTVWCLESGHAYSLIEFRPTLQFWDFELEYDGIGATATWCTVPDWPYALRMYDLGFLAPGELPVAAGFVEGFLPAGEGVPFTYPVQRGRRTSVEVSQDGQFWRALGNGWLFPSRVTGQRTITLPPGTLFYRARVLE